MKAGSDKSLKHFKGVKHEPDLFDEETLLVSPSTAFDLEDWDVHREV